MGEKIENDGQGLRWPSLIRGRLIKRYKRFLADVALEDGRVVTAHCPNSGSMTGCSEPGRPVFLSEHNTPRRKLKYTWELIDMPTSLVGVNTLVPNRLVIKAAVNRQIETLSSYTEATPEVRINSRSRLDMKLTAAGLPDCYVEVKNCTLVEEGRAMFPDARTLRGQKHLRELEQLHRDGSRAVIFFLVQRCDAFVFSPAEAIDPDYARILRRAAASGVEVMVYDVRIDFQGIALNRSLPYEL
ncbi:MAG: DNA/RNA nuclease SfsA [Desulfosarcinaceae bacterium]